ncbi:MAG: hypothetical protein H7A25_09855 [Leptospiraceae bacterium]|nr:hypothetical protein [Leptospiraceae bacterium]
MTYKPPIPQNDRVRKQILVHNAKGNKNRYTIFSKKSLELLDMHIRANRPQDFIFISNQNKYGHIHTRTVQKIIKAATLQ